MTHADRTLNRVNYRMKQSADALTVATELVDAGVASGSINRSYYAVFHAASALLATRRMASSKHKDVIDLFEREFVTTGLVPSAVSRILRRNSEMRLKADYGETQVFTTDDAKTALTDARAFVETAREVLACP